MKTVIVRTPETDRKLLEIPDRVSDLTNDDGEQVVEVVGLAKLTAGTEVAGNTFMDSFVEFPFDDWPLEKNVTRVDGGFQVPASGLYMISANVDWVRGGTISSPDDPPVAASRLGALVVNGTDIYPLDKTDYILGLSVGRARDSGSLTLPLEAGDTVQVFLSWDSSVDTSSNGGDIERAWLSLYRLP